MPGGGATTGGGGTMPGGGGIPGGAVIPGGVPVPQRGGPPLLGFISKKTDRLAFCYLLVCGSLI